MSLFSKWIIKMTASKVGEDQFGNSYYETKKPKRGNRRGRYVIYNGITEASKVPADWHGWLHYTHPDIPDSNAVTHDWQQEHLPNLTGTDYAHRPSGHMLKGGRRAAATGDYEPWQP